MKSKTSITLSEYLMEAINRRSSQFKNWSDFIETATRSYIAHITRQEQNEKDLAIINRRADQLNREAEDVLGYQVIPRREANSIVSPIPPPKIRVSTGFLWS